VKEESRYKPENWKRPRYIEALPCTAIATLVTITNRSNCCGQQKGPGFHQVLITTKHLWCKYCTKPSYSE